MLRKQCACVVHSASLFGDATFIAIKRVTNLAGNNHNSFMKKSSSTSSPNKSKKKKQRTPCLGDFGFVSIQIVKGKEYRRKIEGGKSQRLVSVQNATMRLRVSRVEVIMNKHVLQHNNITKINSIQTMLLTIILKVAIQPQLRLSTYLRRSRGKASIKVGRFQAIIITLLSYYLHKQKRYQLTGVQTIEEVPNTHHIQASTKHQSSSSTKDLTLQQRSL